MASRRNWGLPDCIADPALILGDHRGTCVGPRAELTLKEALAAGWYIFRVQCQTPDRPSVRKRLDLVVEDSRGAVQSQDSLHWNTHLEETILLHVPLPAPGMRLILTQTEGAIAFTQFEFARLSTLRIVGHALREKWRLLRAFGCVKPVLKRGMGLLVRGRWREMLGKIHQGLLDSRAMRQGGYQPGRGETGGHWMKALARKADEADASWWRRHALSQDEARALRQECDQFPDPPAIAVMIVVEPGMVQDCRLAALSVRRQIYPHWELLLVHTEDAHNDAEMATWLGADRRVRIVRGECSEGLTVAVVRALNQTTCSHVVLVPRGIELAEDALYRLACQLREHGPKAELLLEPLEHSGTIACLATRAFPEEPPSDWTEPALAAWLRTNLQAEPQADIPASARPAGFAIRVRPLMESARIAPPKPETAMALTFAGNLVGLSGWDHVAYAVLTGLPSLGVKLFADPHAKIRPDLLPSGKVPEISDSQSSRRLRLIIAPPFLAHEFQPDADSLMFTMWETDELRPQEVQVLNRCRRVIVPSRWGAEVFRRCGVTVPISVVPLGYDPLIFHDSRELPSLCTFGTAGALAGGGIRKNAQHVVDLFRAAFPTEQNVRLRVKVTPTSQDVQTYQDPRIDVLRSSLPNTELARWYHSLTVYVNGSFGEGFGLHLIEALACGRPLITAAATGLTEFFDEQVGWSVPHQLEPVQNDVYRGHWAVPEDEALIARIREVYRSPQDLQARSRHAAVRARGYTWRDMTVSLREILQQEGASA